MYLKLILIIILAYAKDAEETVFFSKFETCGNAIIRVTVTFRTINNTYQVFNGNYTSPIINGENLRAKATGYFLVGSNWVPLFVLEEERGVCALLEKYVGPMFTDILIAGALVPRCPMSSGLHLWKNYQPNFNKMKLQLPNGQIKFKIEGKQKKTGHLGFCLDLIIINK